MDTVVTSVQAKILRLVEYWIHQLRRDTASEKKFFIKGKKESIDDVIALIVNIIVYARF